MSATPYPTRESDATVSTDEAPLRAVEGREADPARARMFLTRGEERYLDEKSREAAKEFREVLQHSIASGKAGGLVRPGPAELWAGVWLARVADAMWRISGVQYAEAYEVLRMRI
jgi:hypothetical protein